MLKNINPGYISILIAASLWGTLGPAGKVLFAEGIHPLTLGFWRGFLALVFLSIFLIIKDNKLFHIPKKDIPFFAAYGFFCITLFYFSYLTTVSLISVSAAVVLLYTAPAFAGVFAYFFLGEALTGRKVFCIIVALIGTFLVVEGYDIGALRLNSLGILTGLASGATYGLYGIFGRKGLARFHYWTVVFYSLAFGTFFMGLIIIPIGFSVPFTPAAISSLIYISVAATLIAFALFNAGLRTVEAGPASIVATVEVVVAASLGIVFLKESFNIWQGMGIIFVLLAALTIQRKEKACNEELQA